MALSVCQRIIIIAILACFSAPINAAPTPVITHNIARASNSSGFLMQNGLTAQQLNLQFASLQQSDNCTSGENGCISGSFAQCVNGQWQVTACSAGTSCFALPLVNSAGTSIACDFQADALSRIQATGVSGGITGQDTSNTTTTDSSSGSLTSGNSTTIYGGGDTGNGTTLNDGGAGALANGTASADPCDDGTGSPESGAVASGGDNSSDPCDGEGNSTSTMSYSTTATNDGSVVTSTSSSPTVINLTPQGSSTTFSGNSASSPSSSATTPPVVQVVQPQTTIQLTAQTVSPSSLSFDSASPSASTGGYYVKLNKRQLESTTFAAPALSNMPFPTPTNAGSIISTTLLLSTPSIQPVFTPSSSPGLSTPTPALAGSSSAPFAIVNTVTVTVTMTAPCTNIVAPSPPTSQSSGTILLSSASTLIVQSTFTSPSGGSNPIFPGVATSIPNPVAVAANPSIPSGSSSSTSSSSSFQFVEPTATATTTTNNIASTPSVNSSLAFLLTATV